MAYDKAVNSAELDSCLDIIAAALRAKAGTSESLRFPDDFVSLIESIQTGGGSSGTIPLVMGTFTPAENSDRVTVNHNLGETPNLYICWPKEQPDGKADVGYVRHIFMLCPDIENIETYAASFCYSPAGSTNTSIIKPKNGEAEITAKFSPAVGIVVSAANKNSVTLSAYVTATSIRYFLAGKTYRCIVAKIDTSGTGTGSGWLEVGK